MNLTLCENYDDGFRALHSTVFFNLFSEAEPFAAILIVHGTHAFSGEGAPEAQRAEIRGRRPRER